MLRLLPLLALACTVAPQPPQQPDAERAIVFVHGYKGAFLANEKGERVWITPQAALSPEGASLELKPGAPPLHPDGPITRLSILGVGTSAYLPFLEFAAKSLPGLVSFSYDWRQDNRDSAKELCAFIDKLPAARVDVVAHSMGGLVTLHCLLQGAPKVKRVVFAGVPFAGSQKIVADFQNGDPVGRNRSLLSPDAIFSFPSAFQLSPPLAASQFPDRDPLLVRQKLALQQQSRQAIDSARPQIEALVILGKGHDTEPGKSDGDGLVTAQSARPPFAHEALIVQAKHDRLLDDPAAEAAMTRFLAR